MDFFKILWSLFLLDLIAASFTPNTSTLHPPLERMLSRKKRFLLMPKGGNLKFTCQLQKALLAMFPRGLNYVIEVAFYYPTPGARIDLIPKRLRKPTTTTPKPIGTKPPLFVCIPGSLICYKAKPAAKPAKVQRIDENGNRLQWIEPQKPINYQNYQHYGQKYNNPQQWAQWAKYGEPQQYEKYKWTPDPQQQQKWQRNWISRPQTNWMNWTSRAPQWTQPRIQQFRSQHRQQRWRRALTRFQSYLAHEEDFHEQLHRYEQIHFPGLDDHYEWHHYHSHRDRRQLFHQFEGLSQVLGFDMKSCIMRAICESKRYLLPPGYSMIQDILRLVFTLPTINGLTDDYSEAMRADYETCDKFLRPKCAFNILNWFLNPKQGPQII